MPWTSFYEPVSIESVTSDAHIVAINPEHHTISLPFNDHSRYRFWPPVFTGQVVPPTYRLCFRGHVEHASLPLPTEPLTYPLAEEFLGQTAHIHEVNFPFVLTMSETTLTLSGVERTYRDQELAASITPIYVWIPYTLNHAGPVLIYQIDAPLNVTVQLEHIQEQPETMMIHINDIRKIMFRYYLIPLQDQPIPECFRNAMKKIYSRCLMRTYMVGFYGRDQDYVLDVEHGRAGSRSRGPIEVIF